MPLCCEGWGRGRGGDCACVHILHTRPEATVHIIIMHTGEGGTVVGEAHHEHCMPWEACVGTVLIVCVCTCGCAGNSIGAAGMVELAKGLATNTTLTEIGLSSEWASGPKGGRGRAWAGMEAPDGMHGRGKEADMMARRVWSWRCKGSCRPGGRTRGAWSVLWYGGPGRGWTAPDTVGTREGEAGTVPGGRAWLTRNQECTPRQCLYVGGVGG